MTTFHYQCRTPCLLTNGDVWTDFIYDGLGRLRVRWEYSYAGSQKGPAPGTGWQTNSETRYVYDGWRVIQERDGSNVPTVSYTRGTDLSGSLEGAGGIGGLLARSHGYSSGNWSTHNFYQVDGNGNITYLVSSSQALAASYRYDPYGNLISSSGTLASANVYRFSSKEIHVNSGLYYYGYRWYAPNLQRWLNRDPMGEEGDINLYAFVFRHPSNWIDDTGFKPLPCSTIGDYIKKNNKCDEVDDSVIKCVAYRESNFDPDAKTGIRGNTAAGLMGITDGPVIELRYPTDSNKFDPALNIEIGSKYLCRLLKLNKGNLTRALDRYGTGTGSGYGAAIQACAKCLRSNKSGPPAKKGGPGTNDPCDKKCLTKAKGKSK